MWFKFLKSRFQEYEKVVLNAVEASLDARSSALFRQQVGSINLIQRHTCGKEVNMYRMRFGRVRRPTEFRFPTSSAEVRLARVRLDTTNGQSAMNADVWLVDGVVFSIIFDRPPTAIAAHHALATHCEIYADVMHGSKLAVDKQAREPVDRGSRLDDSGEYIIPAAAREQQMSFIEQWGTSLPDDYIHLVCITDGFRVGGWTVYGTHVRQVVRKSTNLLVLAEHTQRGTICVTLDGMRKRLFLCTFDDECKEAGTSSFTEVLARVMREE